MSKVFRVLEIMLFSFMVVLMFLILTLGILHPANHLFPWQMAVGVFFGTIGICTAGYFWEKKAETADGFMKSEKVWIGVVLIYGLAVLMISFFAETCRVRW